VIIFKDAPTGDTAPDADTIILDDFSSVRTVGSIWGTAGTTTLITGNLGYSNPPTVSGNVLTATLGSPDGGASKHQLYFRANDDAGSFSWHFIRSAIESGSFINNATNRLRFHVKTPSGYSHSTSGFAPIHVGTYLHHEDDDDEAGMSGSDDDNMHFYHYFNVPGDGLWWQCILDTFPDHQRGASGSTEHGDWEFPESVNHTYHSCMTSFYWDYLESRSPGDITQFKAFTMFTESVDAGTMRQVRSLAGAFDPDTNTVKMGWNRRKDQPNHEYTIRWAHAPFASFSGGTLVGAINAPNTADSNTVYTTFTDAALSGHQWVWVAIQPSGASSFRQIAIDMELNA
jgi:hypothetical protein